MIQAQLLSNECEMRRVWAYLVSMLNTTIHDNQLSTLWLNKSVMTKIRMRGRRFCSCLKDVTGVANEKRRLRSSWRLPTDLSQSNSMLQNSIQTSINDTSTTSEQWMWDEEGISLSRVNAEYDYSRQSTLNTMIEQKCDDQIRMSGRRFCYAWDNR
jgi:hypothetical protein